MKYNTYEEALYNYLKTALREGIETLYKDESLGNWNKQVAFFYQNVPAESDKDWQGVQYPQIIYDVDWQDQPDRIDYGRLNIWINVLDKTVEPVVLAELIKEKLKSVFFNTTYSVYSQSWEVTEFYEYEGEVPLIRGAHLIFDVLGFPDQRTYLVPDPVVGINEYLKKRFPEALVIGLDEMPEVFIPGKVSDEILDGQEKPNPYAVIFLRTVNLTNAGKDTKAFRWTNYTGAVHVIASDYLTMRKTLGRIIQSILIDGETPFFDEWGRLYQLRFTDDGENFVASYQTGELMEGQIILTTEFALLNLPPKIPKALQPKIGNIQIEEKEVERKDNGPELW